MSKESNSNDIAILLGTMQGSTASPAIWLAVCNVILKALEGKAPGLVFTSADGSLRHHRTGEAFVDDTDLWVNAEALGDLEATEENITAAIQLTAQVWERLLTATGGALAHSKCKWAQASWKWKSSGTCKLATIEESPGKIMLTSGTSTEEIEITRVNPSKGICTLGVRTAMDGDNKDELEHRKQQAQTVKQRVIHAPLTRAHASLALHNVWKLQIGYSLGITTLSMNECEEIQSIFSQTFASKMGYRGTMPSQVRYGPEKYGGAAVPSIYAMQGRKHVEMFLGHMRADDIGADLLRISQSYTQLEAGTSKHVMQYPWEAAEQYVTTTWITSLWDFLTKIDATIEVEDAWRPLPQRENDQFLMDRIGQDSAITTTEIRQFQRCRIYLQVTTLSDIVDGTGKFIDEKAWRGERDKYRTATYRYPTQQRPDGNAWRAYRKLLLRHCIENSVNRRMTSTLGEWLCNAPSQQWRYHFSPSNHKIYRSVVGSPILIFPQGPTRQLFPFSESYTSQETKPQDAVPCTITKESEAIRLVGWSKKRTQNPSMDPSSEPPEDPLRFLKQKFRSQWQAAFMKNIKYAEGIKAEDLVSALRTNKQLWVSSDGSQKAKKGGFAWVLASAAGPVLHSGGREWKSNQDSYRMEAAGLLGGFIVVNALREAYQHRCPSRHTLDNESVVKQTVEVRRISPTNALRSEAALLKAINKIGGEQPNKTIGWVRGHQDDTMGPL